MALESPAAVSVGTTATLIASGNSGGGGATVVIHNADAAAAMWVGDANVAVGTRGIPIPAGENKTFVLRAGDTVYGRVASGTVNATVLKISGSY